MKSLAVAVLALAEIGTGNATGERVAPRAVVDAPKTFVGRTIVVPGMACVDNPGGRFVCVALVGGRALRIEASALGPRTKLEIAERLIGPCKGAANLSRAECRFDVEIAPTSAFKDTVNAEAGSEPVSVVFSPQIEMFAPRAVRR